MRPRSSARPTFPASMCRWQTVAGTKTPTVEPGRSHCRIAVTLLAEQLAEAIGVELRRRRQCRVSREAEQVPRSGFARLVRPPRHRARNRMACNDLFAS